MLVVDDSTVMRQIVARTLRQAGFHWQVLEAADGEGGLRVARAERPDLVLSDWHMPRMDGPALLEALRAAGDDVPLGFVTAHLSAQVHRRAAAAGALFVVAKPVSAETLRDVLRPVALGTPAVLPQADPPQADPLADRVPTPLPTVRDVRDILARLLGRDVEVTVGGPMVDPGAAGGAQVSTYLDPYGRLRALLAADLALAARAGAAIALAPAGAADAALDDGRLPPGLAENMREVLDVTASLLAVPGAPDLAPGMAFAPGAPLPPDVSGLVRAYVRRLDVGVELTGYGAGRLSVVVP